uniref:Uncharacterized protein n=1 Tax=Setaria italica TaxID=4555 RepID=K4A3J0_SETIT
MAGPATASDGGQPAACDDRQLDLPQDCPSHRLDLALANDDWVLFVKTRRPRGAI